MFSFFFGNSYLYYLFDEEVVLVIVSGEIDFDFGYGYFEYIGEVVELDGFVIKVG